jgi:hypothetical protein
MSLEQLFCLENLLNAVLVIFPDILVFWLQFPWPQWLTVGRSISDSTFAEFLYVDLFYYYYYYYYYYSWAWNVPLPYNKHLRIIYCKVYEMCGTDSVKNIIIIIIIIIILLWWWW